MEAPVVATLSFKGTGQTLDLKRDSTLLIGRGSFNGINSTHISRKQVELVSASNEVTITRVGTNRSLWEGTPLPKGSPVTISSSGTLTLLETEFPVSIDFLPVELEKHETMRVEARNEITTKEKSPSLVSNSPHSIIAPYQAEKLPLPSPSGNIDDQDMSQAKKYKPVYSDSGATSDSDSEIERSRVEERQENSDISIESSVICEDLSDLENVMDET